MELIEVHITDYHEKESLLSIARVVSEKTGISLEELRSKKRTREIADARFLYFAIAKDTTKKPLKAIGWFVLKDHATVLHGIRQVKNVPELRQQYEKIKSELKPLK